MGVGAVGRAARDLRGKHIFVDVLAQFAARAQHPRLRAVDKRLRAPVRVAVRGRRGVGSGAVARALDATGVPAFGQGACVARGAASAETDVQVVVIAEAPKPEDRAMIGTDTPTVIVLNKADLGGREPGGPLASADRCATAIAELVGLPVVPMVALLASAEIDEQDAAVLRALAATPVDMTSTDAFVAAEHPVPPQLRHRLLRRLDRFGIAHAVLACVDGAPPAAISESLRALSRVDRLVESLAATEAEVGYRRVCAALDDLGRLAAESRDDELAAFLVSDEVVISVMAAAVAVVEATGEQVERGDDPQAHQRRAVHWRRDAAGALDDVRRRCGRDIARGSLRLLGQVQ